MNWIDRYNRRAFNFLGYYVYAGAQGEHNEDARVISPVLNAGEYCLRFYYFLYGQDIHKFRVNTRVGDRDTVLDSLEGNQGGSWHTYSRDITMNTKFQVGYLPVPMFNLCNKLSIIFTENVSCWITFAILILLLYFFNLHWIQHQYWNNRQYKLIWSKVFFIRLRFLFIFPFIIQTIDFLGGHHWRNRQRRHGLWWCVHLPWTLYSLDIIQFNIDSSSPLLTDQSLFLCSTCILGCAWVCTKILYVNVLELKGVLRHHIVYIFIEYFFIPMNLCLNKWRYK